jgi:hypothetical protein
MLQAGRSPVQVPDKVDFSYLPNTSSRTMTLGSTQLLIEMNTRNLTESKKRPARRTDKFAAICYIKIKLRGFRPQANYTDRATAAYR